MKILIEFVNGENTLFDDVKEFTVNKEEKYITIHHLGIYKTFYEFQITKLHYETLNRELLVSMDSK